MTDKTFLLANFEVVIGIAILACNQGSLTLGGNMTIYPQDIGLALMPVTN
jgi:hypothetical protein